MFMLSTVAMCKGPKFTNIQKQLLAPFVVYADLESILQRVGDEAMDTIQGVAAGGDEPTPEARPFQELLPCSFAYKLVRSVVPGFSRPLFSYMGEDDGEMFMRKLQEDAGLLFHEYIAIPQQQLALTEAELRSFHTAIGSHIRNQPLGWDKMCDQCHIVGAYRGATHSRCNLAYRISKSAWKLPVVIHNLKGYDGHSIVKALTSEFGDVRVIPQNMEKYLSITVDRLKFIDSLQFTSQSLNSSMKTLQVDEFKYVREAFPIAQEFELIKRKGV